MSWKVSSQSVKDTDLLNEESLFFVGNGYIGVRGNFEESYGPSYPTIRGTYLNAFHDIIDIPYGEKLYGFPPTQQKMLNVIDSQTILVLLGEDQEKFTITEGELISYERHLHLDKGMSERVVHWKSPRGREVKLRFERVVSFVHRELFAIQVKVEPVNFADSITIVSTIDGDVTNFSDSNDPRVAGGEAKRLHTVEAAANDDYGYVINEAETSKLQTACLSYHQSDQSLNTIVNEKGSSIEFVHHYEGRAGETLTFSKWNIYVDTLRHGGSLLDQVQTLRERFNSITFEDLQQSQKNYMDTFWRKSDVEIDGDTYLQEGIRFNLFHLLQSVGRDKHSNISAKGLSGEGYEGHYFWDTEIYMFPVFLMTNPELAKQLLIYRYSILDNAKARAREMGHKQGALFPWRTISGDECSSFFPAGTAQYHISADIAYSYIQYVHATEDMHFVKEYGLEVLVETARLWMDMGHYTKDGQFLINNVTGPDEYTCVINNNYYTNAMVKHNLAWVARLAHRLQDENQRVYQQLAKKIGLKEEEIQQWEQAAEAVFLPYDEALGINPQDDSFLQKEVWDIENTPKENFPLLLNYHPLTLYRYQVCKQADTVLAHFLLEDEQSMDTIRQSYKYYEGITTHDSSLSTCIFSIMAAKLGEMDKAYNYFIETARLDLDNTHGNTKDGLHMANMGGTWMSIVFGFAGLRIKEDGLHLNPKMPSDWNRYAFHIQYRNQPIFVEVQNDKIKLALQEGEDIPIYVNEEVYTLSVGKAVEVRMS
ncbi:family 65 glycosyl hydrolase [Pontibacillus yanchengensis]|uniref:Family 65 glycosyl hydrolase n=1 Tax=Pontibacillus yanchengensis TaxID=462910 RepID=A0ACC7VIC3_9BACI|nr:family 65 glycosyl hydrolase [Pontibacillus yanchengensis]